MDNRTGPAMTNQTGAGPGAGGQFPEGSIPPGWPFPCFPVPGLDLTERPSFGYYGNVSMDIWKYCTPFIIGIGTFGNLITAVIILRKFRRLTSASLFLMTLALSDTAFLFSGPLRNWINATWERDDRELSIYACKIHLFMTYACAQFSSWLLVGVTAERAISVVWPHKIMFRCTKRSASIMISVTLILICGLNSHFFYGFGADDTLTPICQEINDDETYKTFYYDIWAWIDFAVVFAVPFAILVLCNGAIIATVYKTRQIRRRMSVIKSRSEKVFAKDARNLTVTLIFLSFVFFICLSPVSIFFIYRPYRQEEVYAIACKDVEEFKLQSEKIVLAHAVVNVVSYLNASLNFFLYILSGSKFRHEIVALLKCSSKKGPVFGSSYSGNSTNRTKESTRSTSSAVSMATDDEVRMDQTASK